MPFSVRNMIYGFLLVFFFSAPGLCDSITYYGPDHSEISAEAFQKSSESYQKRYKEAKKTWGLVKTDLIRESIALSGMDHFIRTFPRNIDMLSQQGTFSSGNPELDNKAILIFCSICFSMVGRTLSTSEFILLWSIRFSSGKAKFIETVIPSKSFMAISMALSTKLAASINSSMMTTRSWGGWLCSIFWA